MHLQQENPSGKLLPLLLGTLIGIAAVLFPAALLLAPAYWAYAMCKTRPTSLALFGVVFAVLEVLLLGAFNGACFTVLAIGCAAALYYMQTKRMSNAYTVAAASGIALVCLYLAVCLPGILSGEGAFAAAQALMQEAADAFRTLLPTVSALPAENAALLQESLDAYVASIPALVVPALTILSGVLGLSNFLFFRLFARGKGLAISTLRPFRLWSIPKSLTTGLIVMLVGSLIMGMTNWDYAAALTNTVNAIVGMPLLLQGLCVLDFILSKKADGKVASRRVLAYLVTGVLFALVQTPLIMLGCFDQLFRFRTRSAQPPIQM